MFKHCFKRTYTYIAYYDHKISTYVLGAYGTWADLKYNRGLIILHSVYHLDHYTCRRYLCQNKKIKNCVTNSMENFFE